MPLHRCNIAPLQSTSSRYDDGFLHRGFLHRFPSFMKTPPASPQRTSPPSSPNLAAAVDGATSGDAHLPEPSAQKLRKRDQEIDTADESPRAKRGRMSPALYREMQQRSPSPAVAWISSDSVSPSRSISSSAPSSDYHDLPLAVRELVLRKLDDDMRKPIRLVDRENERLASALMQSRRIKTRADLERAVAGHPEQTCLIFDDDYPVTDDDLRLLPAFKRLETLIVEDDAQLTAVGFGRIADMAKLSHIRLPNMLSISDGSLAALRRLQHLDIFQLESGALKDDDLRRVSVLDNLGTLKIIEEDQIGDAGFAHLGNMTALRELRAAGIPELTSETLSCLARLQKLTHLTIDHVFDDDTICALTPLSALRTLCLTDCSELTTDGFRQISKMTHLTHLEMEDLTVLDDDALLHLKRLTNLQELKLKHIEQWEDFPEIDERIALFTGEGLAALAGYSKLHTLELYDCAEVMSRADGHSGLRHLAKLPALVNLKLDGARNIQDQDVDELAACSNLTSLTIINGDALTGSFSQLQKLERFHHLTLEQCESLTNAGLADIAKLTHLQTLRIDSLGSGIDERGLAQLLALKELDRFELVGMLHIDENSPTIEALRHRSPPCEVSLLR